MAKRGNPKIVPGHQEGFKKGQSGNPGGRPRLPEEVKQLCRSFTEEGILNLVRLMRDKKNGPVSLRATEILLDRAWGKATQPVGGDGDQPLVLEVTWKKPSSGGGGSTSPVVEAATA